MSFLLGEGSLIGPSFSGRHGASTVMRYLHKSDEAWRCRHPVSAAQGNMALRAPFSRPQACDRCFLTNPLSIPGSPRTGDTAALQQA